MLIRGVQETPQTLEAIAIVLSASLVALVIARIICKAMQAVSWYISGKVEYHWLHVYDECTGNT